MLNLKKKYLIYTLTVLLILSFIAIPFLKKFNFNNKYTIGQTIDSLNGVPVYFNGGVDNVLDRSITKDGYNLGLKYQCVEFVKRYYYEYLHHKMPDSYGHAKDYFDKTLTDGQKNEKRNLTQYTNLSKTKPQISDLIIFSGTFFNRFGHVAIISNVSDSEVEIIQQNSGPFGKTREKFSVKNINGKWEINNKRVLGWLRKD